MPKSWWRVHTGVFCVHLRGFGVFTNYSIARMIYQRNGEERKSTEKIS